MSFLQEEAIKRGLRGVKRKHQLQETFDRQYFYRNPSNKNEIKTITRNYNIRTQDFEYYITEFFVVSEPPEGAIEISKFHLQQLMRIKENPPNRYGNK